VQVFLQLIRSSDSRLYCDEVKASETRRTRPDPLNTVEFLKLASKLLGIGPQAAMRTAEHLYLSGALCVALLCFALLCISSSVD
jgi:DNA topoisomerase-3